MSTVDVKYLTHPHDGTPGQAWESFEQRLLDAAAGKTDERGYSLADCLNRTDEGAAGGPPIPAGGGALPQKAQACRRRRLKEAYALIATHELDEDHRTHMATNHFQNGPDAWDYMVRAAQASPVITFWNPRTYSPRSQ